MAEVCHVLILVHTLDLVTLALETTGLTFICMDGKMTNVARNRSVQVFRERSEFKIFLATVSAAVIGLDLTVASRFYLLEPQWNPVSEEQAHSRVHRMGQKKPVVTVHYVMRESNVENIIELQEHKRRQAVLALSGDTADSAH
jgi:SWI/SNF-related matrix-associated actin-dependent regulator of chromatin subfamily A3